MSTTKVFDAEEQSFVRLVDKFYLALSLSKVCATSCSILKPDFVAASLSKTEKDCLSVCVNNIQKTQSPFLAKVKATLNLPAVEDDGEEGGEDDE